MLSISEPLKGCGREEYYLEFAREDYYAHPMEEPGQWLGKGVALLGLNRQVERAAFRNLLRGFSPHGTRSLVQNAGSDHRQCGWDLTLGAPKPVSVVWALAPAPVRVEVERAHRESVEFAMAYLERHAGITRRGKGGAIKEMASLVMATFAHGSSRETDPHLHTHCVLINVACRSDGTTGSVQSRDFFRAKMAIGRIYRDALSQRLEKYLGFSIQPEPVGFHIQGVPRRLCREMSKRSQAIRAELEARGKRGAIAAKVVAINTRPSKQHVSREDLFVRWQALGEAYGWCARHVQGLVRERAGRDDGGIVLEFPSGKRIDPAHNAPTQVGPKPDSLPAETDGTNTKRSPASPMSPEQRAATVAQDRSEERSDSQLEKDVARGTSAQHAEPPKPTHLEFPVSDGPRQNTTNPDSDRTRPGHKEVMPKVSGAGRISTAEEPAAAESSRQGSSGQKRAWGFRRWLRIEWRWMFPKTHIGSAVDGWMSPRLVVTRWIRNSRWGQVLWRKDLKLCEVRVQERTLFPSAPDWSPAKGFKLPVVVFGDPKARAPWADIEWKTGLPVGEARIQRRILFPDAPAWSPLHNVSVPAFRIAPKSQAGNTLGPGKDKGQEHSH